MKSRKKSGGASDGTAHDDTDRLPAAAGQSRRPASGGKKTSHVVAKPGKKPAPARRESRVMDRQEGQEMDRLARKGDTPGAYPIPSPGVAPATTEGGAETKSMGRHKEACRAASQYLRSLAAQPAGLFGDPHRADAVKHLKALEGAMGGGDEYPGVTMEEDETAPGMEGMEGGDDPENMEDEELPQDWEDEEEDEDGEEDLDLGEPKAKSLIQRYTRQQEKIDRLAMTLRGLSAALQL